jgi:DNA-binding transcriptional MerR regulator
MPKRKLVYSLREVCQMTQIPDGELKHWETVFSQIKPIRNRASNRYYTEKDLKLLFLIRDLLYVHKLSEKEVREKLKEKVTITDSENPVFLKRVLAETKMEIKEIQKLLEN